MGKIKSFLKQIYFRRSHRRNNRVGAKVLFSRDTVVGAGCTIEEGVIFDTQVTLKNNIKVGKNCFLSNITVASRSIIEAFCICVGTKKGRIDLAENVYIGIGNYLDNSDNIRIGPDVQIAGPSTAIYTHSGAQMCLRGVALSEIATTQYRTTAPVIIENNVYVGCNCTVYPGVTIGHHSIVAPNSAVTKDVPPLTMVGGVPAREIKKILL